MANVNNDPLGFIYQGVDANQYPEAEGKSVSYNGSWIAVSYINMMIDNDDTDTMKIKTLISYLHNNACELGDINGWNLKESCVYFIDVITMDLYKKLGYGSLETLSLSDIIDLYYRSGCVAEKMLFEAIALGDKPGELLNYLSITKEEFYKPKTTLFTDEGGTKLPGPDSTLPKITFTDDIDVDFEVYKTALTRTNMWVSDKTPNNQFSGQGVSTYSLTNLWFKNDTNTIDNKYIKNPELINKFGAIDAAIKENKNSPINEPPYSSEYVYNDEKNKPRNNNGVISNFISNGGLTKNEFFITSNREFIYLKQETQNILAPSTFNAPVYSKIATEWVIKNYYASEFVQGQYEEYINYSEYESKFTIGHPKGTNTTLYNTVTISSFDWKKAESTTRKPYKYPNEPTGTTIDDHYIISYGGIGKTKKHAFYKIIKTDEANPGDTLKITHHSFISEYGYGKDTNQAETDILHDFTVRNSTIGQSSGDDIFMPPRSNAGSAISGWALPLPTITITSKFGLRNGREHKGVDLGASVGTNVYSSYDGIIVAAGLLDPAGYGNLVVIQHPGVNLTTIYGHLSGFNFTENGKQINKTVKAGELIGKSGGQAGASGAGSSGGPHLHYEIRKGLANDYSSYFGLTSVDPEPYITGDQSITEGTALTTTEKANKGASIAKRLMGDLGLTNFQAAGIVGNLIAESGLIPDRIQGGGVKTGLLKIDSTTGYGYAQWTYKTRQQALADYANTLGVNYQVQNMTDEINYGFLVKEISGNGFSDALNSLKNAIDIRRATEVVLKKYEQPADQSDAALTKRTSFAKQVLAAM
jgi:murein DD-endopeptidase MepM/ murein hydrolase activator NlpD